MEVPATEFLIAPAVERVMPPVERMPVEVSPLTWVLVPAEVLNIFPPVTVSPFEEESPAEERAPVSTVDVPAVVLMNDPPVRVKPFEEKSPPGPICTVLFAKVEEAVVDVILSKVASIAPLDTVEVPVTELRSPPPVRVMPADALMPAAERFPVSTVDVPDTVETMFPPKIVKPFDDWSPLALMPFAKVELADVDVMLSMVASTPFNCVEVPATEFLIAPAVESVIPLVERMPAAEILPVRTVEVPDTVLTMLPPVMVMPDDVARMPGTVSPV